MASSSTPVWTIGSLLTWTADFFAKKSIDEPRLSAELLLAHTLNCSRMALYTQYDKIPTEAQLVPFRDLVKQRANHVPVAYLVGKAWFFSLEFAITRDVLIPRPDTETLVEFIIQHARHRPEWSESGVGAPAVGGGGAGAGGGEAGRGGVSSGGGPGPEMLDLCTGSGAIAITLAKRLPTATITATDISPRALAVARQNAETHKVADRMTFLQGDLFQPMDSMPAPTRFHIVAANPPYIPTAAIAALPPTVRDHEPRLALDGGPDGLAFHRRILQSVRGHLHPGGLLIMEMQFDQGPALQEAYTAAGLSNVRIIRDATGHPRCVVGTYAP